MKVFLWILSLAVLSVGARNFENGLSIDGPLYAAIARALTRTSDLFVMSPGLSEYPVYFDHPHFAFWLHALWLKVFPATDWSIRIPSHLMYVGFLWVFWKILSHFHSKRLATIAVLLLWIWPTFSNTFSNFYLDPGLLLFGTLFLVFLYRSLHSKWVLSLVAGAFLGLTAGYKGLSVLAFGPLAALMCTNAFFRKRKHTVLSVAGVFLGAAFILVPYLWGLKNSGIPNFLELYWQKQMTHRFAGSWGLFEVFKWNFWRHFFSDTHFIGLLMLAGLWKIKNRSEGFLFPFVLFLTVVLMYAPADRSGGQYGVLLLPWAAWLSAQVIEHLLRRYEAKFHLDSKCLMKVSGTLSLVIVLFLQYFPLPTHSRQIPGEVESIRNADVYQTTKALIFDLNGEKVDFVSASPLLWYLDRPVEYLQSGAEVPNAEENKDKIYILRPANSLRSKELALRSWCQLSPTVFYPCPNLP